MVIHSVQEYLTLIESLRTKYTFVEPGPIAPLGGILHSPNFIYRGHSNHEKYDLIPGVFRWHQVNASMYASDFSQAEHYMLYDFISEACRYIKEVPVEDVGSWLEIAQHYAVPTRLLDFTENPLVALYFACSGSADCNGSVWVLNEPVYNQRFFNISSIVNPLQSYNAFVKILNDEVVHQDYQLHTDPKLYYQTPWIYKPYYRQERMNTQESVFMLWAADRRKLTDMIPAECYMDIDESVSNAQSGILCPIIIPRESKKLLLDQLDSCGVNEKFIYPGIDGIGRYIRKKYSSPK